ncbi:hypothetical protein KSY44_09980 [Bacteroides eggerthii]|uniref:hypothetical protein n=1 Tax=Bacteroides eggerthii TaxID=28111 RepID=UPI001C37B162|nr:hypothetical protein [Bacteroides eggerthii]MBV3844936.1 hypothetical protein [Bacteroides eggerthii]MBV3847248.1 hypothetical protein [Bacteroides eggerthii]MBV3885306.1 hypothetical protein [Bacteroides eggerthii]MBV3892255.1 hypothetical protein [Bacteroides eggerthii]MBV3903414.1 hypothetical protein [Bacteroides eggerthii]
MMLSTKRRPFIATALLLTSLGVTTSCIDNSYDLNKDIDMTVNVGGEHLAIPVGYTEQITLDKIIELDEGDDLQLVNGEYHLLKSDKIDETNTSVKMVTVNASSNPINSIKVINDRTYPQPEDVTVEDIESEGSVNTEAHGIDEAVIEIGSLTANTPAKLTLSFEINKTNSISYSDVTIDKMTITFPDFIKFEEGQSGLNGQVLTISNETLSSSTYTIDLYISKYVFGEKYGDGNKVKEENGDRIIKIENQKITVKTDVTVHQAQGTGSLSITPTAILAAMTVSEVNGTIKPDMDVKPTEVELTNLPDFLQDEEVKLDITNPVFSFKANNPLNEEIEMDGIMTGYKNGKVTKTVKIGSGNGGVPIKLKPSGNKQQTISIVRNEKTVVETGATKVIVPNLNDIIETIPDRISVELKPAVKTDDYYTVNLGQDYVLNSEYNIDIPLSFGSGLKIVYEETIDDFDLDLEDVDIKKAIISITADNTIPLKMEIKNENVSALDVNGNKITDINVTVEGTITESKDGKSIATSQLNINLVSTKEGAISKLDGLFFKVTAVPGQATDVQLLSSQWMQLKDMKLKIPNGIKVDLN